jgi:hypothetical protein
MENSGALDFSENIQYGIVFYAHSLDKQPIKSDGTI